jgi:antirestriction protein ArdC
MASATSEPTSTAPSKPEKRDFRREVTTEIINMLEVGVAPWQKPWEPGDASPATPMNPITGRPYRGGNAIHLMATGLQRGYGDPRWMTYRQATQQGWQVRRGEKGTQIEFWEAKREGGQNPDQAQDPNSAGRRNDGERDSGDSTRFIHRVYTVFNAKQVDGIPAWAPKERTQFEIVQSAEQILTNSGARISHDQADRAFYNRSSDSIHLPAKDAFRDASGYYGTALHELAHWTGHPSRLDRATLNESYRFGDMNYAKEELRAELASVFLAAERGIPHDPAQHAAYVDSWIKALRQDKNEIFRAAHDASRATDFLLALERDRLMPDPEESRKAAHAVTTRILGESAQTVPALTDSGKYRGGIIGETDTLIIQRQTSHSAIAHPKELLDRQPGVGDTVSIIYSNGKGSVQQTHERPRARGLTR